MIEIDMTRFDQIKFEDIRKGDELVAITKTDKGTMVIESKAKELYFGEWELENGGAISSLPDLPGETVNLYRRKKVFDAPKGVGAVVKAINNHTAETFHLVQCDKGTTGVNGWRSTERGTWWSDAELTTHFKNHEILSEGVTL